MTNGNDLVYDPNQANCDISGGLTKREYFAAMRNEPVFGDDTLSQKWAELIMGSPLPEAGTMENIKWWIAAHEKFAVMRADALIEALNKQP